MIDQMFLSRLKRNLRLLREDRALLTQHLAGQACGISVARYQQLESGHYVPTDTELAKLAKGFGVSVAFLTGKLKLTMHGVARRRRVLEDQSVRSA